MGLAVTHPVTGKQIAAVNLLDRQGIQNIITKAVGNFTGFAPLGTVLVAMIGVGVAERSGLFSAALKSFVSGVPFLVDFYRAGFRRCQCQSYCRCGLCHLGAAWRGRLCPSGPASDCRLGCRFRGGVGGVQRQFVSHAARSASGRPDAGGRQALRPQLRGSGHGKLLFYDRIHFLADPYRRAGNELDHRAEIGSVPNSSGSRRGNSCGRRKART